MMLDLTDTDKSKLHTIAQCDTLAFIKYNQTCVELRVDQLPPKHPRQVELNDWYLAATNYVVLNGGKTGYEVQDVVPSNVATAEVDGVVKRVCKACGGPLVKKPGRGRWPHTCEGCKSRANNNGGGLTRDVEPIRVEPSKNFATVQGLKGKCALCACGKEMECVCGKNCGHPTHKDGA